VTYGAYKLVHLFGIFMLMAALGGLAALGGEGTTRAARRVHGALHGVGLVLSLLGGFGMLARLGLVGSLPVWVWLKLGLWLLLGAAPVVVRRVPAAARAVLLALPVLGTLAAWIAVARPGS